MRPDDPFETGDPFEAGDPYGLDPRGPGGAGAVPSAVDADDLVRHDHGRLLWNLALAGAQVRRAAQVAPEWDPARLDLGGPPRAVVVATDPATAAIADLLTAVAPPVAPVLALEVPDLPRWVGAADAVLVTSLDGRHPRLVAVAEQAARRGASLAVVAPADSPLAAAAGRGVVVDLPADTAVRAAFWSVLGPALLVADAWALAAPVGRRLDDVAAALDETAHRCRPGSDAVANPARSLAEDLAEATPVVVGSGVLARAAARRWASSLRLFAGAPAIATGLPADLAETTALLTAPGRDRGTDLFRDRVDDPPALPRVVLIGDDRDEPLFPDAGRDPRDDLAEGEAHAAAAAVRSHAEAAGVAVTTLDVPDGHPIVRFAAAAAVGDFTAAYLALGRGLDPSAPRPGEGP